MRRIVVMAVFSTACGEPSGSGKFGPHLAEETHEGCLRSARDGFASCLEDAKTPEQSFVCGSTVEAKKHVCDRIYLGKTGIDVQWVIGTTYWVGDPEIPQTPISCPEEVYGKGWVKNRREESLPSLCLRNDLTGEVW